MRSHGKLNTGDDKMTNWILRWVISAISLAIVAHLGIGVTIIGIPALLEATIVIGLINSLIKPILSFFTMPLNCMTFGLMGFALNALLFAMTKYFVSGFNTTIMGAFLGPILMGLLSSLLYNLLKDKNN